LDELIGSLMTYEITMKRQEQGEKPKKKLAFKVVHHVKEHNDDDDDDDDDDEIEEDFALITKQFQDFIWKK
jgi:DNA recombination-dependent growth factor C